MSEILQRYRFLRHHLPNSSQRRIVVLTGARQTGKTTLSKKAYPHLKYINLDAPENRISLANMATFSWHKSIGEAIIDEAQKEPVVFEKIKYAFDDGGISFSVLTGSSQILLLKNIRESLAGRAFFYELWPLMQCELNVPENTKNVDAPLIQKIIQENNMERILAHQPSTLLAQEDFAYRRAEDYLLEWGGMPALLTLSNTDRWQWLENYGYTYLQRDLGDLARLDDLAPFYKFQKLSALRSGGLLNYSELARDAAVSVDTARRYLEYLKLSYQTFLLQPFHENLTSTAIKTPKLYWTDIGIYRQLTGMRGELNGRLYETMVVSELVKWLKTNRVDANIFFYRTRSGLELDILLETTGGFIGMEIKSRETVVNKDLRAIKEIAEKLGAKWQGGIIVYRGAEIKKIADPGIWAVPSRRLFQSPVPAVSPV